MFPIFACIAIAFWCIDYCIDYELQFEQEMAAEIHQRKTGKYRKQLFV